MRLVPKLTMMRAERAFYLAGRTVQPGEVVEILGELALVLARSGRAVPVDGATDPQQAEGSARSCSTPGPEPIHPQHAHHDRQLFA